MECLFLRVPNSYSYERISVIDSGDSDAPAANVVATRRADDLVSSSGRGWGCMPVDNLFARGAETRLVSFHTSNDAVDIRNF